MKNKLYSIFTNTCPQCHQGKVFKYKNPFSLKHFSDMNETCSNCQLKYEKEVGFFYGAMYVSYALTSGFFIVSFIIDLMYVQAAMWKLITFLIVSLVILSPLTYRLARLIWLNFFFKYKDEKK
ncbi:MAG: DUF983 domain-containing protein [Crocinitomicaceae bacterium]|nr:DUF983 domain-containing protein [Crocinitomicaceae bacterium]